MTAIKGGYAQSSARRWSLGDKDWAWTPRAVVLLIPIPFLVIAALLFPGQPVVQIALLSTVGTLCLLALAIVLLRSRLEIRHRILRETVPLLVRKDLGPAFVSTAMGEITYSNDAAIARFPTVATQSISACFATLIATPDAVLSRLQKRADTLAGAREDIVTKTGHYRLSVSRMAPDLYLWRCDDLAPALGQRTAVAEETALPMLTVGRSDAVLTLNDPMRQLLKRRPKRLDDVFGPEPVLSGQLRRIQSDSAQKERGIVAVVPGSDGARDIYILPASAGQIVPPADQALLSADWQAIENLPVPLMKVGLDGNIMASNRETRALLSVDSTEGKQLAEIFDGLGRPMDTWLKEVAEDCNGQSTNFMRGRGTQSGSFFQVTLKNGYCADGHCPHLIAVLNDVTELKTHEAQFVQSQKMHAIGQLAGGVAHDFNNLLTAISGHCDLVLLRHDQDDQDYNDLIQIHQNANRAASLVGQLLAFSRKQNLQPEQVDLRATLSELTHLLNRLVGEKVSLNLNHDPDLGPIKADKRQLEQVFMNLIVNARDAMPNGGAIDVITRNVTLDIEMERDRAFIPAGEYVEVKVIDAGSGIPKALLPKIFEPFVTTKRIGEGTGLGLSTAYGIVKQTGGYIFASSEVDRGTEFTLLFPRCHHTDIVEAEPEAPTPKPAMADGDGVVLLVEDEAPVRAFASRALHLHGYTVLEADCAETALMMLEDEDLKVDIFLTDVIMPGKDGPTWVREALQLRPQTKVVFVSGYAEDAFFDGEDKIPNSVFLPKPYSLVELTQTVQAQLCAV